MKSTSITLVIGVLAILTLSACGKGKEAEAENAAPTSVQVATAIHASIDRVISADAVLYPVNQANVSPKISAPVTRVLVQRGDHVKPGQLLAELESRDLMAAVSESREQWNQAQAAYQVGSGATALDERTKSEADLASARQALDAAKKVYDSRVDLVKQGALAQRLADEAHVALVQAQGQFETAQRHLQTLSSVGQREQIRGLQAAADAAKARFENTQAQLSFARIISPIGGIVADRPVYPGEMASPGTPLISIVDVSQIVARANIPIADASFVHVGNSAILAGPDGEVAGKVTVVSPAVNPATTTLEVWVQFSNPGERLKPGGTFRVNIRAETLKGAVLVPPAALLNSNEGGQQVIVVAADNTAHARKVTLGVRDKQRQQILIGVNEGEKVVISGGLGLEDGARVRIQETSVSSAPGDENK